MSEPEREGREAVAPVQAATSSSKGSGDGAGGGMM